MCKAGFAGDDAPRAVFRKLFPDPSSSKMVICYLTFLTSAQDPIYIVGAVTNHSIASIVGRPRHHG